MKNILSEQNLSRPPPLQTLPPLYGNEKGCKGLWGELLGGLGGGAYTSNINNYVRHNLVWEYIANCVHLKLHSILVSEHQEILLTLEIDGITIQVHYVKHSVNMCLGNLIAISLRQNCVLICSQTVM